MHKWRLIENVQLKKIKEKFLREARRKKMYKKTEIRIIYYFLSETEQVRRVK